MQSYNQTPAPAPAPAHAPPAPHKKMLLGSLVKDCTLYVSVGVQNVCVWCGGGVGVSPMPPMLNVSVQYVNNCSV